MSRRRDRKGPVRGAERDGGATKPAQEPSDAEATLAEIERVMAAPLHELLGEAGEEEAAEARALVEEARRVPAMARFSRMLDFIGDRRPVTKAGNLKLADAVELVALLGTGDRVDAELRGMGDLPGVAHAYRWAAAAELLARRGQHVVPGPLAEALEADPLTAWLKAAFTLLEHGVLDGFQEGWRPRYVEMLDASVPGLLTILAERGQDARLGLIQESAWEDVAREYGYDHDDEQERRHVDVVVEGLVAQLADAGIVARQGDEIILTALGSTLAAVVDIATDLGDDEEGDLDLVDDDALSLLDVCAELDAEEAFDHLAAWCQARLPEEAADELYRAVIEGDEDPALAALALEAFAMLGPEGEAAARRLQDHRRLRPLASVWLVRQGFERPDAVSPEDLAEALVTALSMADDPDGGGVADLLAALGPPDEQVTVIGVVARSEHPDAARVLRAIAASPAHSTVVRAARRSLSVGDCP
ncbi:MAG TPA: hypothetical protein VK988_19250 [Acidimicrobiales bacterium]|nr:hypothetical protein [Acidimicrobiales bacterium]